MKPIFRAATYLFAGLLFLAVSGCASVRTITDGELGTAKVFSGTRLDIRAINGELVPTRQFKVSPPSNPAVDLPFSFVVDFVMLPLTTAAALFEYIFE
jgi:uncharacterized protein YceK